CLNIKMQLMGRTMVFLAVYAPTDDAAQRECEKRHLLLDDLPGCQSNVCYHRRKLTYGRLNIGSTRTVTYPYFSIRFLKTQLGVDRYYNITTAVAYNSVKPTVIGFSKLLNVKELDINKYPNNGG
ncbi:hypothetical protein L9F63_009235, partial [Diploptera punctata]